MIKKSNDKVVSGVIGGIAEHFDSDKRLLRIIALAAVILTGFFPGVIIYFIAALLMKPSDIIVEVETDKGSNEK